MGHTHGRNITWKKRNLGTLNLSTPTTIFRLPIPGLEDVFFTTGTPNNAVNYLIVKQKITRYMRTQIYCGAAVVSRVIEEMILSVFVKLDLPER